MGKNHKKNNDRTYKKPRYIGERRAKPTPSSVNKRLIVNKIT